MNQMNIPGGLILPVDNRPQIKAIINRLSALEAEVASLRTSLRISLQAEKIDKIKPPSACRFCLNKDSSCAPGVLSCERYKSA